MFSRLVPVDVSVNGMRLFCLGMGLLTLNGLSAQTTIVTLHPNGVETNEPSLAISPSDPSVRILGSNTSYFFVTRDGGFTWQPQSVNPPEGYYGDPVTHITRKGEFYLVHLARNKKLEYPASFDRIVFERSTDQGLNWKSTGIGNNPGKMQDKPWMTVDEGRRSKFQGRIYISWTEFDKYGSADPRDSSRIRLAWSSDGGATFSTTVVSDSSGDARDGDQTLEGATCATGPRGELYMVWAGKGYLWFDQSLDGGVTWGRDRIIEKQAGSWNTEDVPHLMRSNSMPFLTSDSKGILYLVYGDARNGDQDVFLKTSSDGGVTWTPALRLNADQTKGSDQFMPHLARDPRSDIVYAIWYDRRNSPSNLYTDVYLRPLKKGKPGKEYRVTNSPFCPPGKTVFFGDYISVAAARGEVSAAYTVYDHEKLIPTVYIALMNDKLIKRLSNTPRPPHMQVAQLTDTALLAMHFSLPGYKSCTLEIKRGRQIVYKQLFDPLPAAEQEVLIPLSRFSTGVHSITLSFKGQKMEKDLYIESR